MLAMYLRITEGLQAGQVTEVGRSSDCTPVCSTVVQSDGHSRSVSLSVSEAVHSVYTAVSVHSVQWMYTVYSGSDHCVQWMYTVYSGCTLCTAAQTTVYSAQTTVYSGCTLCTAAQTTGYSGLAHCVQAVYTVYRRCTQATAQWM